MRGGTRLERRTRHAHGWRRVSNAGRRHCVRRRPAGSGRTLLAAPRRAAAVAAGSRCCQRQVGIIYPPCLTVCRTRAPWNPSEPRHVPVVHAERGREERTARGYRSRTRGSQAAWTRVARYIGRAWRAEGRRGTAGCGHLVKMVTALVADMLAHVCVRLVRIPAGVLAEISLHYPLDFLQISSQSVTNKRHAPRKHFCFSHGMIRYV